MAGATFFFYSLRSHRFDLHNHRDVLKSTSMIIDRAIANTYQPIPKCYRTPFNEMRILLLPGGALRTAMEGDVYVFHPLLRLVSTALSEGLIDFL